MLCICIYWPQRFSEMNAITPEGTQFKWTCIYHLFINIIIEVLISFQIGSLTIRIKNNNFYYLFQM